MPKGYFGEYLTLAFFAGMMLLLVAGTLGLNKLVSPKVHRDEKYLTYECGVDPVGGGWSQTQIRYYLFGLLFVVFDVEAVFLFPWAVVFDKLGTAAFVEMVIFIGILSLGLAYAWRKKVLEWL
ncbi:MAG: NADH-quinone oxidoreductase subunit [Actinomycetota bacterium]|nr:NADH-quinone oxidoreductase subunit [Actinomycetota bacterium]